MNNVIRTSIFLGMLVMSCISIAAQDRDSIWRPITPAEMEQKTSVVEPDADAEAIFWDVRLDDKKSNKLSYRHYVRVKIFTERGRERFSKIDIPFMKGKKVEDVAARVIKPDGSIVDLKQTDIFEREVAKAGKLRVQAKSFAVPGIEPGVIVEYQYSEVLKNDGAGGERLVFQRDIPMQKVTYSVRPYGKSVLKFNSYNMPDTKFVEGRDGFQSATLTNVPAYKEEPYMPPDDEVRKWVYLQYQGLGTLFQWGMVSWRWMPLISGLRKPKKEVQAKVTEVTAGALQEEEKVRRIFDFVQKSIKNVALDPNITEEQIEKLDIDGPDDVLKRGMGTSFHKDLLFAAMTRAAGFEVAVLLAGDRNDNFFNPDKYPFPSFVEMSGIAVKLNGEWKYFDPCSPAMPFASLPWQREGVRAMLVTESSFIWQTIKVTEPLKSPARRDGKFVLNADGSLEGEINLQYEGHQAISRRQEQMRDSQAKREELIRDEIKNRISTAEVSNISIVNFDDSSKPLTYIMKVRVPNYAQKAGKRLIFQPSFFEFGTPPAFSSATRVNSVYFRFPWSEKDTVAIKLPEGYLPDGIDAPESISDTSKITQNKIALRVDPATNTLNLTRDFYFGANGNIIFPVSSYPALKRLFDSFSKSDTHAVTIKQQ